MKVITLEVRATQLTGIKPSSQASHAAYTGLTVHISVYVENGILFRCVSSDKLKEAFVAHGFTTFRACLGMVTNPKG